MDDMLIRLEVDEEVVMDHSDKENELDRSLQDDSETDKVCEKNLKVMCINQFKNS